MQKELEGWSTHHPKGKGKAPTGCAGLGSLNWALSPKAVTEFTVFVPGTCTGHSYGIHSGLFLCGVFSSERFKGIQALLLPGKAEFRQAALFAAFSGFSSFPLKFHFSWKLIAVF